MGKGSAPAPPPPPDYAGAAREQGQLSLEAQRAATRANRINQITPYGNLTYSQNTQDQFDQAGYDAAMKAYTQGLSSGAGAPPTPIPTHGWYQTVPGDDQWHSYSSNGTQGAVNSPLTQGAVNNSLTAPTRAQFTTLGDPDGGWTQTVSLNPETQKILDKQNALSNQYADITQTGLNRVSGLLSNPELDMTGVPDRAINPGMTAQQAILARLNPQFVSQEEALRSRLANQGITLGSTAYENEMRQQAQSRNDAEQQAALQGIGIDSANRASALQESAYRQDRPLNLLNALRGGVQMQNPTFQSVPMQGIAQTPDLMGAAGAGYNAQMNNYNASQQGDSGLGGLFSIGSALAGLPMAGGGSIGGNVLGGMFGIKR